MKEIAHFQKKQNQTFVLICINFALFMILFGGIGYVSWQSATLVNRLQGDLDRAEQAITQMQNRIQNIDTDVLVERLVTTASEQLEKSIKKVVQNSDLTAPITRVSERITATHEMIEQTGEAIQGIQETVKELDNEQIAEMVSYNILKGLGDGFQKAAETRKPAPITKIKPGSASLDKE